MIDGILAFSVRQRWLVMLAVLLPAAAPVASAAPVESVADAELAPAYVPDVSVVQFKASVAADGKVWLDWSTDIELGSGMFRAERGASDGAWVLAGEGYARMLDLLNPSNQTWAQHAPLLIIGVTPTGRATIIAVDLNRPHQIVARQRWTLVGWHPPEED